MKTRLQLIDITYSWPNETQPILDNINLSFEQGQQYAFTGESGCGKSTLLRLINKELSPSHGHILCNTGDNNLNPQSFLVYQNPYETFNPRLSLMAHMHDINISKLNLDEGLLHYLEFFGLSKSFLDSRPQALSGGTLQKFMLIKALLQRPHILLLDEPDSFLDFESKRQLYTLLNEDPIVQKTLIIIATHRTQIIDTCNFVEYPLE